ncbi:hypothetical protein NC797_08985 [Aquibacillus sp. 3ASR75-11]|uniref:RsgI N-terminal anti-sigma domain-containing protein n=1 Tax=Terrihalobacillus insolitus TaxID=2950438 RepID=A0A9X4ANL1_9BACI|nr:hypothetical protein [Terrihalobacillus insolitus]MDC3413600.1 hypothetical protein [Terrihalobacillus insolitus]MDC3424643.1 hypothetical protein [Terrihalobacillus insolitus]
MRKGVVVKQNQRYTVVMEQDGTFHKANPVSNGEIGMEVFYTPKEENTFSFFTRKYPRMIAITLVFLLIIFPLYGWYDKNEAYAYVNIDINPSVELEVNDDMKVLNLIPLNDDGKSLIDQLPDWKNRSIEQVTASIIDKSKQDGFVDLENNILIGVSYLVKPKENRKITDVIDTYLSNYKTDYQIATFEIPSEVRTEAKEKKVSMNQIMASSLSEEEETKGKKNQSKKKIDKEDKAIIQSFYKSKQDASKKEKQKREKNNKPNENSYKGNNGKSKDQEKSSPGKDKSNNNNGNDNKQKNNKQVNKDKKQGKNGKAKKQIKDQKLKNKNKNNNGNQKNKNKNGNQNQQNKKERSISETLKDRFNPIIQQIPIE